VNYTVRFNLLIEMTRLVGAVFCFVYSSPRALANETISEATMAAWCLAVLNLRPTVTVGTALRM